MFSEFASAPSLFTIGDTVEIPNTPKAGVIVRIFFNQWSNQYVYVVRCPLYAQTVLWCEPAVVASQSVDAVAVNDMVIAISETHERHIGVVVGTVDRERIAVRFGDETHAVHMTRVQSVMPASLARAAARAA